ncbi:50S ribosomal protein L24 [Buchnera aphidicola]|uniref:50S ribosomal protein L24 n=1 Tax=Buchnera aphidicola TaxID=9 RepID=UPI003464DBF7
MALKIKFNDKVIILSGKDKNKVGIVKKVFLDKKKIIVEGVCMVKIHKKPNPSLNQIGGIQTIESPIPISKVAILNPKTNKKDRVGFKFVNGKKVRFLKSDNTVL